MWRHDVYNLWCLVTLNCCKITFWRFTLFCRDFFVAIYALLCGEKLSQKLCLWRKKDKYDVWNVHTETLHMMHKKIARCIWPYNTMLTWRNTVKMCTYTETLHCIWCTETLLTIRPYNMMLTRWNTLEMYPYTETLHMMHRNIARYTTIQ